MSDIKKFTGFIAPDGSTHNTMQKATAYTLDLKIKQALADFAVINTEANVGVTEDNGTFIVCAEDMPAFLFAHKADILAAFKPEVTTRKKRVTKPKVAKAVKAEVAVESPAMGAAMHAGVLNLDE